MNNALPHFPFDALEVAIFLEFFGPSVHADSLQLHASPFLPGPVNAPLCSVKPHDLNINHAFLKFHFVHEPKARQSSRSSGYFSHPANLPSNNLLEVFCTFQPPTYFSNEFQRSRVNL